MPKTILIGKGKEIADKTAQAMADDIARLLELVEGTDDPMRARVIADEELLKLIVHTLPDRFKENGIKVFED